MSIMLSRKAQDRTFAASLGELLVGRGRLGAADLGRALSVWDETGERIEVILTRLGLVPERDMAEALAVLFELPLAEEEDYPAVPVLDDRISGKFLKEYQTLPLADAGDELVLAMVNPADGYAVAAIEMAAERRVVRRVAVPSQLEAAFERLYGTGASALDQAADQAVTLGENGLEEDIERLKDLASEAPVIRMVNILIANAKEGRASDIHIEPFERNLRVRYRIDGVLRDVEAPPRRLQAAVISRIKIMANLNIAERRLPQDGRIKLAIRGKDVDMRVSTVPTIHGESVVMRILDRGTTTLDFREQGFEADVLARYRGVLHRPNGILLVTGPTGSGKTTTLYTSLAELNDSERKILTVEDPIEYQIQGINQVQVKPQIGLTFASALRAFLRQDPDIVMIGEIRDVETAQIAVQAALTGHLVLSTLHTNDAASSVTRLLDMGVEDYLLTSTVRGILAQRLVRRLCPHCREPHPEAAALVRELGLGRIAGDGPPRLHRPVGCAQCSHTGFRGRAAIMEFLELDAEIRRLVLARAEPRAIQDAAQAAGMRPMYEDGLRKVAAGLTTVEEVLRVTREG